MASSSFLPRRPYRILAAAAVTTAAWALACTADVEERTAPWGKTSACTADAKSIQIEIFEKSCSSAGCHGTDTASLGLDFASGPADALIGRSSVTCDGWALVVPGSPETSFLYQKLVSDTPACGARMPIGGHASQEDIDCIGSWIESLSATGCETCGGDGCVSLASDADHCGGCENACPEGVACVDGQCSCGAGRACDGACVDTLTDPLNCGDCGTACGAGSLCEGGICSCPAPLDSCPGTCADLKSDPAHCGSCETVCAQGQVCLLGACADGCGELQQCGSSCVDTLSSVLHCGGCDKACPGGVPCVEGACTCPGGGALCGAGCADLQADEANCGACGVACGPGETCNAGTCGCDASATPSFTDEIEPILARACAGSACHGGARPKEELSLESGLGYDELVGVATSQCGGKRVLVDPGSPSTSYLMQKLLGTDICTGTQMPKAGASLPSGDIDLIAAWICVGAPDN